MPPVGGGTNRLLKPAFHGTICRPAQHMDPLCTQAMLIPSQQLVNRCIENLCKIHQLYIGNKALTRLDTLNGVLIDVKIDELKVIRQLTLRNFHSLAHTGYFDSALVVSAVNSPVVEHYNSSNHYFVKNIKRLLQAVYNIILRQITIKYDFLKMSK